MVIRFLEKMSIFIMGIVNAKNANGNAPVSGAKPPRRQKPKSLALNPRGALGKETETCTRFLYFRRFPQGSAWEMTHLA